MVPSKTEVENMSINPYSNHPTVLTDLIECPIHHYVRDEVTQVTQETRLQSPTILLAYPTLPCYRNPCNSTHRSGTASHPPPHTWWSGAQSLRSRASHPREQSPWNQSINNERKPPFFTIDKAYGNSTINCCIQKGNSYFLFPTEGNKIKKTENRWSFVEQWNSQVSGALAQQYLYRAVAEYRKRKIICLSIVQKWHWKARDPIYLHGTEQLKSVRWAGSRK